MLFWLNRANFDNIKRMNKIKSVQYFDQFATKSSKEQLEIVNDSRKQIEELIGEVKFILSQDDNQIPPAIAALFERHVNELKSENLFSRVSALTNLLNSIQLLEVSDKAVSEFVERNQPYITEYLENLTKVEVTKYAKTKVEHDEFLVQLQNGNYSPSMVEAAYEMALWKPFREYVKLIEDCMNKIAKNEKKGFFSEDYSLKEDEVSNHNKWLARVRGTKNGGMWLLVYDMLLSFMVDIHDGRVSKFKKEASEIA